MKKYILSAVLLASVNCVHPTWQETAGGIGKAAAKEAGAIVVATAGLIAMLKAKKEIEENKHGDSKGIVGTLKEKAPICLLGTGLIVAAAGVAYGVQTILNVFSK